MNSAHITELMEALQEWADDFREKRHPASLTIYRAIQHIKGQWIKATDINRPGGWYWTRLGADDESCPCVVFVAMDNDGDSAPDFRVVWNGESERTAKRLSHYADKGWEFMEIPMPGYDFAAGGGTVRKSGIIALSAPGGNTCNHCGTELERDCMICGAPNCCPKCCRETALEITLLNNEMSGGIPSAPSNVLPTKTR